VRRLAPVAAALCAALSLVSSSEALNPQIAGLQIALRHRGLYRGPIDGIQGPRTRQAVRTFQRRKHLAVDGLAGPRTHAALGRFGRPLFGARVIRGGMVGYDVGVLQFLLRRHGLRPGRLDGRFGARTDRAVRRFQRRAHLAADGIVGHRTARRLCPLRACGREGRRAADRPPARLHRVRWGETLTEISRRYQVSVERITRANRLDPRGILYAGARLRIPGGPTIEAARAAVQQTWTVRAALDYWSRRYGVDPRLVRALAWFESGFNNGVVSRAGAQGVMQVTPATWAYVEKVLVRHRIPHTLSGNVQVGVAFLHELLHEFPWNVKVALAAYTQGPRSVRTLGIFRETKDYVADVLALRSRM
jgi:LysM repeat protein